MSIDITMAFTDRELLVYQGRSYAISSMTAQWGTGWRGEIDYLGRSCPSVFLEPSVLTLELLEVQVVTPEPRRPKPPAPLMRWAAIRPGRPWRRCA